MVSQGEAASPLGTVLSVSGSYADIRLAPPHDEGGEAPSITIGNFLGLKTEQSLVVGVVTKVDGGDGRRDPAAGLLARTDLLGEIRATPRGPRFQRGITRYPTLGGTVHALDRDALRLVFDAANGASTITIGQLQQDPAIGAAVKVDDMLRKHFALLGSTGVGKSSGVAVLLRQVLEARPHLRIFLIDPHNEYANSFPGKAQILNPKNLKLPFWLFNFEETVDVFFRGRPGVDDELEILAQLIPVAKGMFASARNGEAHSLRKVDASANGFTVDTPVPYRLADLVNLIDERMGRLENRSSAGKFSRLVARIETVRHDPRYAFMFDNANVGGDTMADVIDQLFRLQPNGKPMTVMQLAGFPAEVVDSVVSVLGRMAFEFGLWSDGAVPLLFVCEEAHRYAPGDKTVGFGPTRKAISRIAKEGRKYGVFLGMVTQRPAELDPTIVSQCNTLFVMRMANERDQNIIRSAVSDAAANLLAFLPSLGTREVFAFGEGVALPTRLQFAELPADVIPRSQSENSVQLDAAQGVDRAFIDGVVERWRGASMGGGKRKGLEGQAEVDAGAPAHADPLAAFATEAERALLAKATRPAEPSAGAPPPRTGSGSALRQSLLRR